MGSALTDSFRNSGPTGNAMPKLAGFSDEQKNILADMQKEYGGDKDEFSELQKSPDNEMRQDH